MWCTTGGNQGGMGWSINDMARATGEVGFVLFADDSNLFAEGQDPAGLFKLD
jgi:hypothetical protein